MVCWSVIAMLKEYILLALTLSALAVLAALTLHEKCCTTGKPKDLESNQEEDIKPEGQLLIESGGPEEIQLEVKLKSPTGGGKQPNWKERVARRVKGQ